MEWLTPTTIVKYFQIRRIWCSYLDYSPYWHSGITDEVYEGKFNGIDYPEGDLYTIAWYAYFKVAIRAYDRVDEDPTDTNIYLQVKITTIHNAVWSSIEPEHEHFNDVGALVWTVSNQQPPAHVENQAPLLGNYQAAINQLYNWAGVNNNNVVCGVVGDIGSKEAKTLPNGTWGTHSGTDTPVAERTFTLTLPASAFNPDGSIKPAYSVLPFVFCKRSREPVDEEAILETVRTINLDLTLDPFIYIPWGVRKSGDFVSCNRLAAGLTKKTSSGFTRIIKNSILSRIVDGQIPSTSNGFRKTQTSWEVSPLTPEDD